MKGMYSRLQPRVIGHREVLETSVSIKHERTVVEDTHQAQVQHSNCTEIQHKDSR